jgi:hypothetical protein
VRVRKRYANEDATIPGEGTPPGGEPEMADPQQLPGEAESGDISNISLSMEEEEIIIHEANEAAASIDNALDQAEQMVGVTRALEELANIVTDIEKLSPIQVELIDGISQMAVAGTDADAIDILPPLEVGSEGRLAVESFQETIKKAFAGLVRWLKGVWDAFEQFFRLNVAIPTMKARITAMVSALKDLGPPTKGMENIKLRISPTSISANDSICLNGAELLGAMKNTIEAAGYVFTDYATAIVKKGDLVSDAMKKYSPIQPTIVADRLCDDLAKLKFPKLPGAGSALIVGQDELYVGKPLLGNVRLQMKTNVEEQDNKTLGQLERYRRSNVSLSEGNAVENQSDVLSFKRLSPQEMTAALIQCANLCRLMNAFYSSGAFRQIKSTRQKLERNSDAMTKTQSSSSTSQSVPYYNSLVAFNTAFAGWARTPVMPMFQRSFTSVRTILGVVSASMAAYDLKA